MLGLGKRKTIRTFFIDFDEPTDGPTNRRTRPLKDMRTNFISKVFTLNFYIELSRDLKQPQLSSQTRLEMVTKRRPFV